MNIELYTGDAERLRPLFESRKRETQRGKFGLELEDERYMEDIRRFLNDAETDKILS